MGHITSLSFPAGEFFVSLLLSLIDIESITKLMTFSGILRKLCIIGGDYETRLIRAGRLGRWVIDSCEITKPLR